MQRVQRALCGSDTITGLDSREQFLVNLDYFEAYEHERR